MTRTRRAVPFGHMRDDPSAEDPGFPQPTAPDDLGLLVAEIRAADAVQARARERSLRQQATEEATFHGLLVDLAEARADVTVRTRTGRAVQGRIMILGRDFLGIRVANGSLTLVALGAVSSVRRRPGSHVADTAGARPLPGRLSLAAYLSGLAPERPRIAAVVDGEPAMLSGQLQACGTDVVTLRVDGSPTTTVYVALSSVSELTLASG